MNFFTKVDVPVSEFKIDYTKNLMFVGSCFAQNMAQKFIDLKFNALTNPFGVVYNPLSIRQMFRNIAYGKRYTENDIFFDHGTWNCWEAHSSLSSQNKEKCLLNLNKAIFQSAEFLKKANIVFITLGSAFVYFLKNEGVVVSNCHRQDESFFERKLISVEEAICALNQIVEHLHQRNSKIKIVFTISPLRHLRDGAHGNNLSKSTLHLAVAQVVAKYLKFVSYFPSYEIVMDELRDYRFYANDMIHLSDVAENFIFEKMGMTYFNSCTLENVELVKKFMKAVKHKVENFDSPKNKVFVEKYINIAKRLVADIPGLDLQTEIEMFQSYEKTLK